MHWSRRRLVVRVRPFRARESDRVFTLGTALGTDRKEEEKEEVLDSAKGSAEVEISYNNKLREQREGRCGSIGEKS